MKINDIINEVGFFSGLASKLQPKVFQQPTRGTGEISSAEAAKKAEELYGIPAQEEPTAPTAPTTTPKAVPLAPTAPAEPEVPADPGPEAAPPDPEAPAAPEEPVSLADEPLARDERISVETPAGTMYKYPNGRWYQMPTTGLPTPVPPNQYAILDDYANMEGHVEKIPPTRRKKR